MLGTSITTIRRMNVTRRETSPAQLPSAEAVLRDGRRVLLRPIRPDDRQRWFNFVNGLTPRTRYLRFQYAKNYFSEEEADYFTHVTAPERGAYVAALGRSEEERIIAVGRWDVIPGGDSAEVALVVEEDVQFRGIGTALLEQLAIAAAALGIRSFEAQVLSENTAMQGVFEASGLRLTKRLEEGIYLYDIDLTQQEEFARRRVQREHVARSAGVEHLIRPKSIAVIGASRDPDSPGGAIFRNLLRSEFTGTVFPVNPKAASVAGVMSYPSVADIPGDVDLAIIVVPAGAVLDVVDGCARKGIWGLVVISAGFGETGEEGKQREQALRDRVLSYGGRLVGPNCLGIVNANPSVSMNATFAPSFPAPGTVSMGSQSGALGIALLDYISNMNLGLAQFVSFGNRVDVSPNDLLEYWEDDADTEVILLYLESFGNPRKFTRTARRVTRSKPIIAVKGGRSASGARAASSHTGSLAGADIAVDALFRQAGVIRVGTIEEMFGVAQLLAHQPAPKGNRVAIVTNAGGPGILAADACENWDLQVAPLNDATQATLRAFLPPEASVANPVDMIASATPEQYRRAVLTVLNAPEVDAAVLIYIPPLVTTPEEVAAAVRNGVLESGAGKPVLACFMMARGAPPELHLDENRYIPSYSFPDDAVRALAHARDYAEYRDMTEGEIPSFHDLDADGARELLRTGLPDPAAGGWLQPDAALRLLMLYGIPVTEAVPRGSGAEAAEAAAKLGFPVAMKANSQSIVHKTEVGGVALGLRSKAEVQAAFEQMKDRVETAAGAGALEGVIVQRMMSDGQELIAGMTLDPVFGPLIMLGLGGVEVEVVRDVAFAIHPLTDLDPGRMLDRLKGCRLLDAWRGRPARDKEALGDALLRFSALIEDFPEIQEIEINPMMVFEEGRGCAAVDARVRVGPPPTRRHASSG